MPPRKFLKLLVSSLECDSGSARRQPQSGSSRKSLRYAWQAPNRGWRGTIMGEERGSKVVGLFARIRNADFLPAKYASVDRPAAGSKQRQGGTEDAHQHTSPPMRGVVERLP